MNTKGGSDVVKVIEGQDVLKTIKLIREKEKIIGSEKREKIIDQIADIEK